MTRDAGIVDPGRGFFPRLRGEIDSLRGAGTYKVLNYLESPQSVRVRMRGRGEVLILSSNNYLGLCNEPEVVEAGKRGLEEYGAGTASVRFICGSFRPHEELERKIAAFLGLEAALTYVSCWNANTGLMPTFLGEDDVLISDELNHASIIDGSRLTKTRRLVFPHADMKGLEAVLKESRAARSRFIISDGVFSMEGDVARVPDLLDLARRYDAVLALDDSHGTGVLGETGRGTPEHFGLHGQVDIVTSTLGKALGGAAGGFTAGPAVFCDYLTQKSRPQLFSNALPPTVACSSLAAIGFLERHPERVARLRDGTAYFRGRLAELGFRPIPGITPIVPILLGETQRAIRMSEMLLDEGVFVTGFGYPVVPQGQARLRCQISAIHSRDDLDEALAAFARVGRRLGAI
ncbi:MAG: glycine C-acetyltransferase [Acidobacteria bacterium]|nr:glycine C-acetyltransferase [Acidobacteriota bacterium]